MTEQYWFKAVRVEPLEIGIEADTIEEAEAILKMLYEGSDWQDLYNLKFVRFEQDAGIVVGDSTHPPKDATSVSRLAKIMGISWVSALGWCFESGVPVSRWAQTAEDTPCAEMTQEEVNEIVEGNGSYLIYVPFSEEEILARMDPQVVLEMYADEVGRNAIIEYHGEVYDSNRVREPMHTFLEDDSLFWPKGITIRQEEGFARVVDRAGVVLLTTF